MARKSSTSTRSASDDRPQWRLTSPAGNEYTVTSAVEYYNLKAQGYSDSDPDAAAEASVQADEQSSAQLSGPAEGTQS